MDNGSGVGVLDKAALVLAALEAGPATLAGLVAGTGLARPTAHRLAVADLVAIADQAIDDIADDALGLGIALDLSGRCGGRERGREAAGEHRSGSQNCDRFHYCPFRNMRPPAERGDRARIMRQELPTI